MSNLSSNTLQEVALRIREMREIFDFSVETMAEKTEVSVAEYCRYESGELDFPFTFIYKCSLAFGLELTELLEGHASNLSHYTVTRKGEGLVTAEEDGICIQNLAPMFQRKLGAPYWVTYKYSEEMQIIMEEMRFQ